MPEAMHTPNKALNSIVTPPCPHFEDCGGCQHQNLSYEAQVAAKARTLEERFAPFWSDAIPVEPSPEIWHYRNKIDPSFAGKYYEEPPPKGFQREVVLGFKKRWYWTIDLDECLIAPEGAPALIARVREWAREQGYPPYNARNGQGLLRMLLVREGKRTGERMVVLVTNEGDVDADGFTAAVRESFPAHSVQHAVFTQKSDVLGADRLETWEGGEHIHEALVIGEDERRIQFRISPLSFFQTNTLGAEKLYAQVRAWIAEAPTPQIYDLYGGSGAFAFVCADLADTIDSIEEVPSATDDGRHNAILNDIGNVQFTNAKVEHYLRDVLAGEHTFDTESTVIADPPRPGFQPKALRRLLELGPKHLVYISCKHTELLREMPDLLTRYRLTDLRAVDMFPHTGHVEVLAKFERI
jgi:23S rRNA (uracil1939-C5)-methyltransferase